MLLHQHCRSTWVLPQALGASTGPGCFHRPCGEYYRQDWPGTPRWPRIPVDGSLPADGHKDLCGWFLDARRTWPLEHNGPARFRGWACFQNPIFPGRTPVAPAGTYAGRHPCRHSQAWAEGNWFLPRRGGIGVIALTCTRLLLQGPHLSQEC